MPFNSMIFLWIFLPIILAFYYLCGNKIRNIFLVLVSLLIYVWGSLETLPVLLISIIANYILGIIIDKQEKVGFRKVFFALGILFNIGALSYFKYFNFFAENISGLVRRKF